MAAAAPALNAAGTNSWPSRASFRATNTSPGSRLRVSMEKPVMRRDGAPSASPRAAATRSAHSQSDSGIDRCLRQGGPHCIVIREGQHGCADDLAGLVALAGNQQHISVAEEPHARPDGLRPIADLTRAGAGGQDLGADGGWRLAPRVVVGNNDVVRIFGGDAPHDRTL